MSADRLERFAPLTGAVFFVLVVVAVVILGKETPQLDDSTREVVSFWTSNDSSAIASSIVGVFASLFFVWFAASLRSVLWHAEGGSGRLASISFGGALILATGLLTALAIEFTTADSAGDVPPEVTQTLSTLNYDFYFPMAAGFALFLLSSGIAGLRFRALPRVLAWIAIALGVLTLTPVGFFAFLGGVVWVGATSVILFRRGAGPVAPAPMPPPD